MEPTYRELQAALKTLKEQGKTTVRLNAPYGELLAEFQRIDTAVEVSIGETDETGDDPEQPVTNGSLFLPKDLWDRMLALIPDPLTAALFREKSTLSGVASRCELRNGKLERLGAALVVVTDAQTLSELLRCKAFLLESAFFQLTGTPASIRIKAIGTPDLSHVYTFPHLWTRSTKCSQNPTPPECTRSLWHQSATSNTSLPAKGWIFPPSKPTSADTPTCPPSAMAITRVPSPG
jgi:hypothetical protein